MILADWGLDEIFNFLNKGGMLGVLVLIIVSGAMKKWVFGWQYKDLEQRLSKVEESNLMWMQLALRGANVTETVVKKMVAKDSDPS